MISTPKQDLAASIKQTLFIQPGCIWYLPVNYSMEFPPTFLFEDGKDLYKQPDTNFWKDPESGKYIHGSGAQEIVLNAKVRPFLVFQKPGLIENLIDLKVPGYYGKAVTGFPITRLEKLEKNISTKIEIERLRSRNDYEFIHYISDMKKSGLLQKSCVILCTPMNINVDFFTTYSGHLSENDMTQIKRKIAKILSLTS